MKRLFLYSFFFINFSAIIVFWLQGSGIFLGEGNAFIIFGRLAGLLAVYFVLLQFILIGRGIWIERVFGLDKLSRVHHLNAFLSIFFIIFHPALLTIGYSLETKASYTEQFLFFINSNNNLLQAFAGLILFISVVFLSFYIVRKRFKYEIWYFVHLFTYLAVFLAWGHQLKNGTDFLLNSLFVYYWYGLYIFVLGNHFTFRCIRPLYFFNKHRFFVEKLRQETHESVSIYISGKNMKNFHIEPGQFMIFRFLSRDFWWQAHPFSLSRDTDGKNIRITIKNSGDFTSEIPKLRTGTPVIIEGPLGTFTAKRASGKKILLIAGGIGITPIRSLLEHMASMKKDIVLIYGNKGKEDIVFKKEIESLQEKYNFPVYNVLSREIHKNFLHGHIDGDMIKKLVTDVGEREVFICGPIPMMEAVRGALIGLGVSKSAIHYERFSL